MEEQQSILIINDDENELEKLQKLLTPLYEVEVVKSSIKAVDQLNNEKNNYLLVITSLNISEMNGFELCLNLKKDINSRKIQVIILGTLHDYNRIEQPDGLRSSEYEKIIRPYTDQDLLDVVKINIEKQIFLKQLEAKDTTDETTGLYCQEYFEAVLNYEMLRCSRLNLTLNCVEIDMIDLLVKENLLSIIKNVCRYYDIATVISNRLLLLLPNTSDKEGEKIFNRLCSLIFGLKMNIYYYNPEKTDEAEFKKQILG